MSDQPESTVDAWLASLPLSVGIGVIAISSCTAVAVVGLVADGVLWGFGLLGFDVSPDLCPDSFWSVADLFGVVGVCR